MSEDLDQEIAWRAMPDRTPVVDAAGNEIGEARRVMGDDQKDIFHGLAVKLREGGRTVEITADRIPKITRGRVYTSLAPEDLEGLPTAKG